MTNSDRRFHAWIPVDSTNYDKIAITENGTEVHTFISPYEIPEAVRGYYDHASGRFVIDFEYITGEKVKKLDVGPPEILTIVGRKTGRIRGFQIDVNEPKTKNVSLHLKALDQAIEAVKEANKQPKHRR